MAEQQKKTVATPDARVEQMHPAWEMARAMLGGTDAMRKAGQKYLPRAPKEDAEAYARRLAVSVLFPAYLRTVTTLAGKPFSKPVTIGEDVPSRIAEWMEDVDLEGRNLHAFAGDCMEHGLGYGLGGILVDFPDATAVPATAAGVRTEADERKAGLRPYWVQIFCWQILGWRAARPNGQWALTQLRLMEEVEEADGEYGIKCVQQVRVLTPGAWQTHRLIKDDKGHETWALHQEGRTTLGVIPFVPIYGKRLGFMLSVPPLLEVAHLNVAHWQSASDQQNILHVARVPILCARNVIDSVGANGEVKPWEMVVGGGAAVRINGENCELGYVEHTGAAIGAGEKDLESLEERMRQAGAELLVIDTKLTATQVASENAVGMCALQRIAQNLEDALDQALDLTAKWVGEASGGHVTLYDDYGAATLQEASAQLLLQANTAGKLSDETLFSELKRRGIVGADVEWDAEKDRIGTQGPALGTLGNAGA